MGVENFSLWGWVQQFTSCCHLSYFYMRTALHNYWNFLIFSINFFRLWKIRSAKLVLIVRIYFASRGTWGGAWNCSLPRWTLSIRDAPYPSAQLPLWALLIAPIPSQVSKSSWPLTSTLNPYFGKGCSSWNFYVQVNRVFKFNPNGTYNRVSQVRLGSMQIGFATLYQSEA